MLSSSYLSRLLCAICLPRLILMAKSGAYYENNDVFFKPLWKSCAQNVLQDDLLTSKVNHKKMTYLVILNS